MYEHALLAQLVERVLGKNEVSGPSPEEGSPFQSRSHLAWQKANLNATNRM